MAKDPTVVANLWVQRLSASTEQIKAGVLATTVSPGKAAAAQVDAWINGVNAAREKFIRNSNAVTVQQWQTAMIDKGVPRVATGAQAALNKMIAFQTQWLPFVEAKAAVVRAMPKGGLENGVARAVAQIRANAEFVKQPYNL